MDIKIKDNSKLKLAPFTQLEYIESTGTQYIKLDYIPSYKTEVILKVSKLPIELNNFFGCRTSSASSSLTICYTGNNHYDSQYGNNYQWVQILNNADAPTETVKTIHIVPNGRGGCVIYVDDVSKATYNETVQWTGSYKMLLFGTNLAGTITPAVGGRIHEVIIKEDDVELLHLFPSKYNNEICFYDTISKSYVRNTGSGVFVAGPVVKSGIPETILLKTTTFYHKNTPNVDSLLLLNGILNAQETAEDVVLNRIRVDIGNVSGSLSKLMQYASMAGFNDNYEPQTKPRLVGTWTINDWYTPAQLAQAQSAFDGLTVVGDPNYVIDFSQLAVQTLDSTQPNYNPAASIILQSQNVGTTLDGPVITGGGRYFLRKSDAATAPTTIDIYGKTSVTDSNAIVSEDTTQTYSFSKFNEFIFFSGLSTLYGCFNNCGLLTELQLPTNITTLDTTHGGGDRRVFKFPGSITSILYLYNVTKLAAYSNVFSQSNIINIRMGNPPTLWNQSTLTNWYNGCTILIGVKDKYADKKLCEYYKNSSSRYNNAKSYYDYITPKLSYDGTNVTITLQITGTVYYTTDGSTPTEQSTEYTQPFAWNGQGVIKAIGVNTKAKEDDRIAYADNFYAQPCATPTITADSANNQVIINCATTDAVIYYTVDGTHPTLESSTYSGPIDTTNIGDFVKVRCFATATGYNDSEVVSKICVLDDSLWGTDGDTSTFAVQCIDSTKPNYNPSVCIILGSNNKLTDKCYGGGGGYITKTQAAAITTTYANRSVTTVTDTNCIVSSQQLVYEYTNADWLKYTSITSIDYRFNSKLNSIKLPNTLTTCVTAAFCNCNSLSFIELPSSVTYIGDQFAGWDGYKVIHLLATTPPTLIITNSPFYQGSGKFYVGDGSSASHDDAILADYVAASGWSSYSSMLGTWYNYLHPTT